MNEFVVYILYSGSSEKFYIGFSSHLIHRFHSHNCYSTKGFTLKHRPWKLVHVEFFENKKEAMKREKILKSGQGRYWIKNFVLPVMKSNGFISA